MLPGTKRVLELYTWSLRDDVIGHAAASDWFLTEFAWSYSIAPASSPGPTVTVVCRCVGIAWKTQSEMRGRAWQEMQKKVYDSTKK